MNNQKKTELDRLPNEIKYLKNEISKFRKMLKKIHEEDTSLMENLDTRFDKAFSGVEKEIKLLRTTLVLLLLANMPNKNNRKSFLKMVEFIQNESDFQSFADDLYGGIVNTKKLGDVV